MTARKKYGTLSAIAALAAVVALGAAFALARGGGEDADDSASAPMAAPEAPASPASDPEVCRLKVTEAVLTLDNRFLGALSRRKVTVEAVSPAAASNARQIELKTRVSVDVSCDTTTGVIGLRGGVRLQGRDAAVDMRRWRINTKNGALSAYFGPRDRAPISALRVDLREAARSRRGKIVTIAAPVELADGGVAAVNHAFRTEFRSRRTVMGTLTLTTERIEAA